jgi:hypothetical protein
MQTLEKINEILYGTRPVPRIDGNTCVHRVRVLRSGYASEEELKCRACETYSCERYLPVRNFEIPLNQVRFQI